MKITNKNWMITFICMNQLTVLGHLHNLSNMLVFNVNYFFQTEFFEKGITVASGYHQNINVPKQIRYKKHAK